MGTILAGLKSLFFPARAAKGESREELAGVFRQKYNHFQSLLESNTELLKIFSELEVMREGREVFGVSFIKTRASRAVFHALRMVQSFERLSGRRFPELTALVERLRDEIKDVLAERRISGEGALVLDMSGITAGMVDEVGGKCANLGEVTNRVGLPVPAGFAVTTTAFRRFFESAGLGEEIDSIRLGLDPSDPVSLRETSEAIQAAILRAPLPQELTQALDEALARLAAASDKSVGELRLAVRSSAIGEDGELSFAGQYLSMLGVVPSRLAESYKYVAASLFTPRAISYRLLKGVPSESVAMSAACILMAEARAAGVMFTREPSDPGSGRLLINAVWGLGPYAVDGVVTPDTYLLDRESLDIVSQDIPEKTRMLTAQPLGGLAEAPVPEDMRAAPCLTGRQARQLGAWGMELEKHYGKPQDVEWAVDEKGRITVLQSRQLTALLCCEGQAGPPVPGCEVLAEGGQAACTGAGGGVAHHVRTGDDLETFPDGGVLVAAHSSPKFMLVMRRASAIVTEHGSVTGHMASLVREFSVPALLGVKDALKLLPQGETVTVDASGARIYRGRVNALLAAGAQRATMMTGTPVHEMLVSVASLMTPLNLLDPKAPGFAPAGCRTLHDLTRLLHEWSYGEMFSLSDLASGKSGMAVRLDATTGLDLHIIDLGGGIAAEAAGRPRVTPEEIVSRPFRALLAGLVLDSGRMAPRPVNVGGFLSVMSEQMIAQPKAGSERFGDKSYAVISDKYLNFSSRVGYHYGVLDCYCGQTVNKNYITFSFKGGAADDVKRARRARAIALILERLGFTVESAGDRVAGRYQKFSPEVIEEMLTSMGRLLQFTRQADMLMVSEQSVAMMAECFLAGADCFDPGLLRQMQDAG